MQTPKRFQLAAHWPHICDANYDFCRMQTSDAWFGLHKTFPKVDPASYYLDGNPTEFRNWALSEPSSTDLCVRIRKLPICQYADWDCSSPYTALCKMTTGEYFQNQSLILDKIVCWLSHIAFICFSCFFHVVHFLLFLHVVSLCFSSTLFIYLFIYLLENLIENEAYENMKYIVKCGENGPKIHWKVAYCCAWHKCN